MAEKGKTTKKSERNNSKKSGNLKIFLQVFLMALAIGSISVFAKITVRILPPFTLIFFQFFLIYIALSPIVAKRGEFNLKSLKNNFIPALMLVMSYIVLYFSLPYVKSLNATLIYISAPIILLLHKSIFQKNSRISSEQEIGLIVGFLGIFLIVVENLISLPTNLVWNNLWTSTENYLLVLIATIFLVLFKVFSQQKMSKKQVSPFSLAYYSSVIAIILSFFPTFFVDFQNLNLFINKIEYIHIFFIIWLGIICVFVFLLTQTKLEKKLTKNDKSVFIYLQFFSGLVLIYLFLNEKITFISIFGGILIFLALKVIEKYEKTKRTTSRKKSSTKKNLKKESIGDVQNGDILKVQVVNNQR